MKPSRTDDAMHVPASAASPDPELLESGGTAGGPTSGADSGNTEPRLVQRLLIGGIHVYQGARAGRPSPCRFMPSCSAYGEEAIAVHGAAKGSLLTLKRIARCRPGGGFGVDLVPPRT